MEEYVEGIVCQISDIRHNELKEFDLDGKGKVLLVNHNGTLSALGHKCTHYGAPLEKGALGEGRVRCPWHGACFDILTGDIEDFPGLDSLPCYDVTVVDKDVKVRAKLSDLTSNKRMKSMRHKDPISTQKVIVIGGGPSAATCVETLRQEGYTGCITMICKENTLPYDRVKLSKALDTDVKKILLRNREFYKEYDIDVILNVEVKAVDKSMKKVILSNGERLDFKQLYIATGCKPRRLDFPGSDLRNVCTLRDFKDSEYINSFINKESDVVILGGSFIGMEVASYSVDKAKSVTIIFKDRFPFEPQFGNEIGKRIMEWFQEKGVQFKTNNGVQRCSAVCTDDSKSIMVDLNDDTTIRANILIMGVGTVYCTDFLKESGVKLDPDGSIIVNEYMQSNIPGIYAGGDVAKAPVFVSNDQEAAIGHYSLAQYHGRVAGRNMMGKRTPLQTVPYFTTKFFDKSIRYAGHGIYDSIEICGSLEELRFIVYFFKDDLVVSMASCMRDPVISQFAEMLAKNKRIYRTDVERGKIPWFND